MLAIDKINEESLMKVNGRGVNFAEMYHLFYIRVLECIIAF